MYKTLIFFMRNVIKNWIPVAYQERLKRFHLIKFVFDMLLMQDIDHWSKSIRSRKISRHHFNLDFGMNIIGFFRSSKGISESARSLVKAIKAIPAPHSIVNVDLGISNSLLTEVIPEPQQGFKYDVNIFSINPPEMRHIYRLYGKSNLVRAWSIGYWYWELNNIPETWNFAFDLVDEVWVASSFIKQNFQRKSNKPVFVIPPSIEIKIDLQITRADFGLPDNKFLFICAYDCYSIQERKNPLGAIRAFKKAFSNNPQVGLVVKISNGKYFPDQINVIHREINSANNIYLLEQSISRIEMYSLINLMDSCISLHRSEGFGLVPAEAMALGKPVIMTNWSGNTDFMTNENCLPVDFKLVTLPEDYGPYRQGEVWAEPSETHAVDCMRALVDNPSMALRIGNLAKETIECNFSPKMISGTINARLKAIHLDLMNQSWIENAQNISFLENPEVDKN